MRRGEFPDYESLGPPPDEAFTPERIQELLDQGQKGAQELHERLSRPIPAHVWNLRLR